MKRKVGEVQVLWDITVLPMMTRAELDFEGVGFRASNYDTAGWSRSAKGRLDLAFFRLTQKDIMARLRRRPMLSILGTRSSSRRRLTILQGVRLF